MHTAGERLMLGWIKPDDNVRPDHDCYHLGEWLEARGIKGVSSMVRTSPSSGRHERERLLETGELERLLPVARELAENGSSVIMWACTSGSFIGGLEWSRRQAAALEEATGKPSTSTTLAIIAAAEALGARRLDLLGTYPEAVTAELAKVLGEAGFLVENVLSLNAPSGRATFELDLCREAKRMVGPAYSRRNPVVIPDTAANSLDLLDSLEKVVGRPIIAANQATLWHGLVLLGLKPAVKGGGVLFEGRRLD